MQTVIISLTLAVVLLIVIEVAVRTGRGSPVFQFKNLIVARSDFLAVHTNAGFHPILGWVPKEGVVQRAPFPHTDITTGAFGIRLNRQVDDPMNVPIPENAILCVGDSFTFGSDVDDPDAWPAILESRRGEPVVNGGGGGWGTDQIVLRAMELVPRIAPRVVVLSFLYDDLARSTQRTMAGINKPYFTVENGRLIHHNDPVPLGCGTLADLDPFRRIIGFSHAAVWLLEALGRSDLTRIRGELFNDVNQEELTAHLVAMIKAFLDARGIRLIVMLQFGNASQFDGRRRTFGVVTRLLERLSAMDVEWINSWYVMSEIFNRDLDAFKALHIMTSESDYRHLSPLGNALIAELVDEALDGRTRPSARLS